MNYQDRTKAELIDALHLLQKEHTDLKSSYKKEMLELQNKEGLFRTILYASPDDITITDLQGKILMVSDAALRLFRITRREDVLGCSMMEYLDPADRERAMLNFLKMFQGIGSKPTEYRGMRTDGSTFDVEVNGEFVRDAEGHPVNMVFVVRDITERKSAEKALKESQMLLKSSIESQKDTFFFTIDRNYKYLLFNKVHAELMKLVNDKDIKEGMNFLECISSDEHRKAAIEDYDRVFRGESYSNVRRLGDAEPVYYEGFFNPIFNEKNEVTGATTLGRNINDRKQREEEIKQKNSALHLLNAEKDKFFSILAHDLRSPFNSLLGFAQMMEENLPTMTQDQVHKIVKTIKRSATNLFLLLENLLEWSRLQRGMVTYTPSSFLLKPWLSQNMILAEEAAKRKDIKINYEIPDDLLVFADENMLGGLVRNLSSNAVKFTPKGGKVSVSAKLMPDGWVEVSVQDSGIGMNKQMIGDVFMFDKDTRRKGTDKEPSTGLGLIICKEFIEKHRGKLWIESEVGKGSTIYFTILNKEN